MPVTLFIERDPQCFEAIRRVRRTVSRGEYADKNRRDALLQRIINEAADALRAEDETVIGPCPVILELDAETKAITRQFDFPNKPAIRVPGRLYWNTTYAHYAEVLEHIDTTPTPDPELSADMKIALAQANGALKEKLLEIANLPAFSVAQSKAVQDSDEIDLRLRVIIRRRDYKILESKQSDEGGKLVLTSGEVIE